MHPTLSEHVLDLAQNAFEAGAREVRLDWARRGGRVDVTVRDDGRGMDAAQQARALDPFGTDGVKHPGRAAGLGLPFAQQAAEQAGGALTLESAPGRGTTVRLWFAADHIDAPPAGDAAGALTALMAWPGPHELTVRRETDGRSYAVRRSELAAALGGLEGAGALALLRAFFESNEEDLNAGGGLPPGKDEVHDG